MNSPISAWQRAKFSERSRPFGALYIAKMRGDNMQNYATTLADIERRIKLNQSNARLDKFGTLERNRLFYTTFVQAYANR
jgi:hypothetical protein